LSRELRHWLDENANAPDSVPADGIEVAPARRRGRMLVVAAGLALGAAGALVWMTTQHSVPSPAATVATSPAATPAALAPAGAGAAPSPVSPSPQTTPSVIATAPAQAQVQASATASAPSPEAEARSAAAPAAAAPVAAARAIAPRIQAARVAAPKPPPTKPGPPARDARPGRDTRLAAASTQTASGSVRIAVSPWGNVEVNGTPVGSAPPLNELTLPEGRHQIVIRNADFPPYSATISVSPGQPVSLKHKFGS
jgi:serine/threonine-protein kinase